MKTLDFFFKKKENNQSASTGKIGNSTVNNTNGGIVDRTNNALNNIASITRSHTNDIFHNLQYGNNNIEYTNNNFNKNNLIGSAANTFNTGLKFSEGITNNNSNNQTLNNTNSLNVMNNLINNGNNNGIVASSNNLINNNFLKNNSNNLNSYLNPTPNSNANVNPTEQNKSNNINNPFCVNMNKYINTTSNAISNIPNNNAITNFSNPFTANNYKIEANFNNNSNLINIKENNIGPNNNINNPNSNNNLNYLNNLGNINPIQNIPVNNNAFNNPFQTQNNYNSGINGNLNNNPTNNNTILNNLNNPQHNQVISNFNLNNNTSLNINNMPLSFGKNQQQPNNYLSNPPMNFQKNKSGLDLSNYLNEFTKQDNEGFLKLQNFIKSNGTLYNKIQKASIEERHDQKSKTIQFAHIIGNYIKETDATLLRYIDYKVKRGQNIKKENFLLERKFIINKQNTINHNSNPLNPNPQYNINLNQQNNNFNLNNVNNINNTNSINRNNLNSFINNHNTANGNSINNQLHSNNLNNLNNLSSFGGQNGSNNNNIYGLNNINFNSNLNGNHNFTSSNLLSNQNLNQQSGVLVNSNLLNNTNHNINNLNQSRGFGNGLASNSFSSHNLTNPFGSKLPLLNNANNIANFSSSYFGQNNGISENSFYNIYAIHNLNTNNSSNQDISNIQLNNNNNVKFNNYHNPFFGNFNNSFSNKFGSENIPNLNLSSLYPISNQFSNTSNNNLNLNKNILQDNQFDQNFNPIQFNPFGNTINSTATLKHPSMLTKLHNSSLINNFSNPNLNPITNQTANIQFDYKNHTNNYYIPINQNPDGIANNFYNPQSLNPNNLNQNGMVNQNNYNINPFLNESKYLGYSMDTSNSFKPFSLDPVNLNYYQIRDLTNSEILNNLDTDYYKNYLLQRKLESTLKPISQMKNQEEIDKFLDEFDLEKQNKKQIETLEIQSEKEGQEKQREILQNELLSRLDNILKEESISNYFLKIKNNPQNYEGPQHINYHYQKPSLIKNSYFTTKMNHDKLNNNIKFPSIFEDIKTSKCKNDIAKNKLFGSSSFSKDGFSNCNISDENRFIYGNKHFNFNYSKPRGVLRNSYWKNLNKSILLSENFQKENLFSNINMNNIINNKKPLRVNDYHNSSNKFLHSNNVYETSNRIIADTNGSFVFDEKKNNINYFRNITTNRKNLLIDQSYVLSTDNKFNTNSNYSDPNYVYTKQYLIDMKNFLSHEDENEAENNTFNKPQNLLKSQHRSNSLRDKNFESCKENKYLNINDSEIIYEEGSNIYNNQSSEILTVEDVYLNGKQDEATTKDNAEEKSLKFSYFCPILLMKNKFKINVNLNITGAELKQSLINYIYNENLISKSEKISNKNIIVYTNVSAILDDEILKLNEYINENIELTVFISKDKIENFNNVGNNIYKNSKFINKKEDECELFNNHNDFEISSIKSKSEFTSKIENSDTKKVLNEVCALENIENVKNSENIIYEDNDEDNLNEYLQRKKLLINSKTYFPKTLKFKTIPNYVNELSNYTSEQLSKVENFTVYNKHGKITFKGFTDIRFLNLDDLIEIKPLFIELYPNTELPPINIGLNKPAILEVDNYDISKIYEKINAGNLTDKEINLHKQVIENEIVLKEGKIILFDLIQKKLIFEIPYFTRNKPSSN